MVDVAIVAIRKRKISSRGMRYDSYYITLCQDLFSDKNFPFEGEEKVIIRVRGKGLRIDPIPAPQGDAEIASPKKTK